MIAWHTAGALVLYAIAAIDGGDGRDGGTDATADAADATGATDAVDAGGPDATAPLTTPPAGPEAPRAPPATLRGRVLEKGTRRPLAGVTIVVDGAPVAETDLEGRFAIAAPAGPRHVQIQLSGHEPLAEVVEARVDPAERLLRLMPILTGERFEARVRSGRPELPHVAVSADEARGVAGTSGDPMRVIASLPGVAQIAWPAALYAVRGANPGNTGFFLDGVRVPALFHLALGPSVIHPYLLGGVDFYPGGYPASYGGYASGIMAARTAAPPGDRAHASADVTAYDAGGVVTTPFNGGRGRAALAARYSYTGALLSLLSEDTLLRYGDYQLRIDHPLGGGQGTVFALGSLDELGGTTLDGRAQFAALQFHRVDLRWRRPLAGGHLLAGITPGVDWARSTLFSRPIRVRALNVAPRVVYDRELGAAVALQVGADANLQTFDTAVPDFQRRTNDLGRSRRAFTQGGFATLILRLGPRLTIAPGFRADLFFEQETRRFAPQPRLNILWRVTDVLALKLDVGLFAQMPTLPVSVPGFEAFGLADLGLQTSAGGSLGVEARLPRALTFSVTGYAARVRLTDIRDIDLSMPDPGAPDYLVSRRGRTTGVEVLLRRADLGRIYGWLAYTLSWSTREDDTGVFGPSDWDQRHILNTVAGVRFRRGISLGARIHYNTGRRAPIIGSGGDYRQLPAFYQLDLRAERRFVFDRFLLDLYIDFANVTLTRNILQLAAEYDPVTERPRVIEQGYRIILPTVGVHGQF